MTVMTNPTKTAQQLEAASRGHELCGWLIMAFFMLALATWVLCTDPSDSRWAKPVNNEHIAPATSAPGINSRLDPLPTSANPETDVGRAVR